MYREKTILVTMDDNDFQEIMRMQQMMSRRIMNEQTVDRKVDILSIINDITNGTKKTIQVESVVIEAISQGIDEKDATNVLDQLDSDGLIALSGNGYLRLV